MVLLELVENYIKGLFGIKSQDEISALLNKCINDSNNEEIINKAQKLLLTLK